MSGSEQVMTILLEADEMRLIQRSWPHDMRLAVCLMPSGDCQLMLYHRDESQVFPTRLKKHLGLRESEIAIHPSVDGFAERSLKYSDERALASLLADRGDLAEEALDYSVNFAFAREEGLNPIAFLGMDMFEDTSLPSADPLPGDVLFTSSRAKPKPPSGPKRNLHFDLEREAARNEIHIDGSAPAPVDVAPAKPPLGFLTASRIKDLDTSPSDFQLSVEPDGGLVIRAQKGNGPSRIIRDPQALFLRDDRGLLALHLQDDSALPAEIRILPHAVPMTIQQFLEGQAGPVDVTVRDEFLYVTLASPTEVKTSKAATASPKSPAKVVAAKSKSRWSGLRLLALTTLTTIAIFLVLNSQLGSDLKKLQPSEVIDWDQFRTSMQSDKVG